MPTYEYACKSCGQHLEVVQSFTDDALTTCPACGGTLRKVFGNIGISFKGSGFYKNDSRSTTRGTATGTNGDGSSSESGATKESTPKEPAAAKEPASKDAKPAKDAGGKAAPSSPAAAAS
jgi:putative FmdB family regulatory protein